MQLSYSKMKNDGLSDEQIKAIARTTGSELKMDTPAESSAPISESVKAKGGLLNKIIGSIASPIERGGRFVLGTGAEAGNIAATGVKSLFGDKEAVQKGMSWENPFLTAEQERVFRKGSATEAANLGLKEGANIASILAPAGRGVKGLAATEAVRGGLVGGANTQSTDANQILADVLSGAGTGAVTGAAMGALGRVIGNTKSTKVSSKTKEALAQRGTDMRTRILKPEVEASPSYMKEVERLTKVAESRGYRGSARQQLEQMSDDIVNIEKDITNKINKAPGLPKATVADDFAKELKNTNYLADRKKYQAIIKETQNRMTQATKGGAKGLYKLKSDLRKELGNAFEKDVLNETEEVKMAAYRSLKSSIDRVSPEVRKLNNLEHDLFTLSRGLVKSSKSPEGLSILGFRNIGGEQLQKLQDFMGRGLQKGAGIQAPTVNVPPALQQVLARGTTMAATAPSQAPAPVEPPRQQDLLGGAAQAAAPTSPQITDTMLMQARLSLSDSEYKKIKDIYDMQQAGSKATSGVGKASAKDVATARSGLSSLESYEKILSGDPSKLQKQLLPGKLGARDLDSASRNILDAIARLRTGAAMTRTEEEFYRGFLPSVLDDDATKQAKLDTLRQYFSQFTDAEVQNALSL